jgi:hypothetical protein
MRGVVLCVVTALGINAIAAAEPASASMAAANQSYKPAAAADQPSRPAIVSVLPTRGSGRGCRAPRGVDVQRARRRQARGRARPRHQVGARDGGEVRMARQQRRALGSRPILAGAQHGGIVGRRPVNELRNRSCRLGCCQYLGSHVHREHRRRRRGTAVRTSGAAPPTPLGRAGGVPGFDG